MLDILPGFGRRTLVLGALNATDDSFSGDGYGGDVAALVRCGVEMARDGADALDVGAASSRPGHGEVPLAQELGRARSAVAGLCAAVDLPISVDSTRAEVVSACLEAGARIVNDVSCLSDQRLAAVAAARGAALIVVHTLPSARTRAEREAVPDGIVPIVRGALAAAVDRAVEAGLPRERVLVDPGLGFAKTAAESFALLRELDEIRSLGPLVVGSSRKGHLGAPTGRRVDERIFAGAAAATAAILAGADVVRVHDVAGTVDAVRTADAVRRGLVTRTAYIGLGANVGDARATLRRAVAALSRLGRVGAVSGLWRTEPMYLTDQPPFLNAVVSLETSLSFPAVLVSELKRIERELGRVERSRYGPRELDLDLLMYAGSREVERDGTVSVPHERIAERRFVLGPLAELAPDALDPRGGKTVAELLAAVADQGAERVEGEEWTTASS